MGDCLYHQAKTPMNFFLVLAGEPIKCGRLYFGLFPLLLNSIFTDLAD